MKSIFTISLWLGLLAADAAEITISGTRFLLDGQPFPYTGVSFFNALYNTNFSASVEERQKWLKKFGKYKINVLRVWCQWDNGRGFPDAGPASTMYGPDGALRERTLTTVKAILKDMDEQSMVMELVLFSQESWRENIRLDAEASRKAVTALTQALQPYRNLTFQIWNEHSDDQVLEHVKTIKALDPKRLVTNSPGYAGNLGDEAQNRALDYLTPHTTRQSAKRHWEVAPKEIASLLERYGKPVVDDEPARNGTSNFGGPKGATSPYDHILQIYQVWKLGAYITYHHDMFQTGYGSPAVPLSGVPDPEFSPYHRQVFEFIALRDRYQ